MSDKNISLREWARKSNEGKFDNPDVDTQCEAGWYDWFCHDSLLAKKTDKLGRKVLQLMRSSKVNPDTMYVFFKNNCPCVGSLYDDFRFCDLRTGDVIYTIIPRSGFKVNKGRAEVHGRENNFKSPLVAGTWRDVMRFFYPKGGV